jgi:hypothetical protein
MPLEVPGVTIHPWEDFVETRFGRTVGAAVGAVLFLLFLANVADRLVNPVSAAQRTDVTVTVTAP